MPVEKITVRGRDYTLVKREPYVKSDGAASTRLHWQGACAVCGASYVAVTRLTGRDPAVRCATCQTAGLVTPAQVKARAALGRRAKRKPTAAQVAARQAFGELAKQPAARQASADRARRQALNPTPAQVAARLARGLALGERSKHNPTRAQVAAWRDFGRRAKEIAIAAARNPTPAQVAVRQAFAERGVRAGQGRRLERAQAAGLDLGAAAVTDWILNGGPMPSGVQKVT